MNIIEGLLKTLLVIYLQDELGQRKELQYKYDGGFIIFQLQLKRRIFFLLCVFEFTINLYFVNNFLCSEIFHNEM